MNEPNDVSEHDGEGEIAATIGQKLVFSLEDWDGTSLHFRYKPFRIRLSKLYEEEKVDQDRQAQTAWLVGSDAVNHEAASSSSSSNAVNADFQYPGMS